MLVVSIDITLYCTDDTDAAGDDGVTILLVVLVVVIIP